MKNFDSGCLAWRFGKEQTAGGVGICGMEKNKNPASQKNNCASRIFDGVPLYAEELFFYFSQR